MKHLMFLIILIISAGIATAQRDTSKRYDNRTDVTSVKDVQLTRSQQNWLNANYKLIGRMPKDSAAQIIRKNFSGVSETTIEYMIGQASNLMKGDRSSDLAILKQQLEQLKSQKQDLSKKINQKESELSATTDEEKKVNLRRVIVSLKRDLSNLNNTITSREDSIRRLESED